MWGSSQSTYEYQPIPAAEIEDRDYIENKQLDNGSRYNQKPNRRTPFQNFLLFSIPLVLLMLITWILVVVSSSDRQASITNSLDHPPSTSSINQTPSVPSENNENSNENDGKIFPKNKFTMDNTTGCAKCPTKISTGYCTSTISPVLGGLDFVDFHQHTNEGERGTYFKVGSASITATYHGYTFYFLTVENQQLFQKSPEVYIPQYGGFCSWGIGGEFCPGYPWAADCLGPSGNWGLGYKINNKLYFFYESGAVSNFFANANLYITQGNQRWGSWFGVDETSKKVFSTNCYVAAA